MKSRKVFSKGRQGFTSSPISNTTEQVKFKNKLFYGRFINGSNTFKLVTGFTLVELLVVISIIAILLAVLLPALTKAREQSRAIICLNNEKTVAMAILMYAEQNRGKLPNVSELSLLTGASLDDKWVGLILSYCGQKYEDKKKFATDYFKCPSRTEKMLERKASKGSFVTACDYGVSYGSPSSGGLFNVIDQTTTPPLTGSKRLAHVKNQSQIIMTMDSQVKYAGTQAVPNVYDPLVYVFAPYTPEHPNGIFPGTQNTWAFNMDTDKDGILDSSSRCFRNGTGYQYNQAAPRHGKRINVNFVDGHCQRLSIAEWTQKSHWVW